MVRDTKEDILDCYQQAAECRKRADLADDCEVKDSYEKLERLWASLARHLQRQAH